MRPDNQSSKPSYKLTTHFKGSFKEFLRINFKEKSLKNEISQNHFNDLILRHFAKMDTVKLKYIYLNGQKQIY